MRLKPFPDNQKANYNKLVSHIVQSWEWGEFRKKLGIPLYRFGLFESDSPQEVFSLSLHKIPLLSKNIGYLPKGPFPSADLAAALATLGKDLNCAAIKLEPNLLSGVTLPQKIDQKFRPSSKDVFAKYNYLIDLSQTENQLLSNMHPKSRYNIKVAQKHKVWVEERTDDLAFEIYLKLYFDTVSRQKYFGHNKIFHTVAFKTLRDAKMARILIAFYTPPGSADKLPLSAWMIYNFHDTLYYPYGGSSPEYRNVMATNLVAWEAIKLGKRLKLKTFDLWGALPPETSTSHPWQGFHNFKAKLGGKLVSNLGAYDLIFDPLIFTVFSQIDKATFLKVMLLKALKK